MKKIRLVMCGCACLVLARLTVAAADAGAATAPRMDPRVDESIERGLAFLAAGQKADGAFNCQPSSAYAGVYGLCGMAFLAKGYLPGAGKYGENINRVTDFLLANAAPDGYLGGKDGRMYSHCIATLFLSEISGMVDTNRQARMDVVLPKAIQVIVAAQQIPKKGNNKGGWRYGPGSTDSDMSCSGWALMTLRSARLNGAPVPDAAIKDAVKFVLAHYSDQQGSFGYQDGAGYSVTLTGAGLLCLELCGQHGHPATLRAAKYLMGVYETLPSQERCFYGMYYTSQGLFQIGGPEWQRFSTWMYDYWIPRQAPDGHWERGEQNNCPYYQTAMVVLAFAVPYRQLPIYQRDETVDAE